MCIGGMLAFEMEGRTMPQLPEQTKTCNLFVVCSQKTVVPLCQVIADRLNIGKETVHLTVTEDLGTRKFCARFVPNALTKEQKQKRVVYCQDLLLTGQDKRFGENIITGVETWCFAYDQATKRQSAEWVGQNSPKTKENAISKIASEDDVVFFTHKV